MDELSFNRPNFQTHFISKELTNYPQSNQIISNIKRIYDLYSENDFELIISVSFGKRIIISADNIHYKNISIHDLIEIVDYNPIKKMLLAIGEKIPNIEAPVHWIIHKARHDINAIVQINGKRIIEKYLHELPKTDNEYKSGTIDLTKEILRKLKKNKRIIIKNRGCIFTGINLKEIEDFIFKGEND